MKRLVFAVLVLSAVAFGAMSPALAQETKVELSGGISYPLLSSSFSAQQGINWLWKAGVRVTPNLTVSVLRDHYTGHSDISGHANGPVEMNLYGAQGSLVVNGEQDFQLIAFLSLGVGDLYFDNPVADEGSTLRNNTRIKWWGEIGGGAQFGLSKHWILRIQLAGRRLDVRDPSFVVSKASYAIVPSAELAIRF